MPQTVTNHIIGPDLRQIHDHTAIAVIERRAIITESFNHINVRAEPNEPDWTHSSLTCSASS